MIKGTMAPEVDTTYAVYPPVGCRDAIGIRASFGTKKSQKDCGTVRGSGCHQTSI